MQQNGMASTIPSPDPPIKRSSSSLSSSGEPAAKRLKRPYHHHHRLQIPVQPGLREPAIPDDATVTHLMNRAIGQVLKETGFDLAEPVALDSLRNATEEFILHFASLVRQTMSACRRIQPIPQDFEHALRRSFISFDDLTPHLKPLSMVAPTPTLLPSPPPEEQDPFDAFAGMPVLDPVLSGEDDRVRSKYIPPHFPQFPSKHTYRYTPVFTERELDPRKIRERATEDGRHGEEALRKLARAAFRDTQAAGAGPREKRLWGRKHESMESMFEKTVRGLAKKAAQKNNNAVGISDPQPQPQPMEVDGGAAQKQLKSPFANIELGPIVNCERGFWRKTATGPRKTEKVVEAKAVETKDAALARVERWVST
ncbi:hypothetical protein VTN77DRAFT_8335 [Rasamsonia byssochlamydoides]|uniref:uncharacterized protein n=1 Tax=Rasamsonia byssochlamydoides TaxID=89139 RepID=UPI003742BD8D